MDGPEQDRAAHDAQMGATGNSQGRDPREVDGSLTALAATAHPRGLTRIGPTSSAAASVLSEPELLTAALEEAKEGAHARPQPTERDGQ